MSGRCGKCNQEMVKGHQFCGGCGEKAIPVKSTATPGGKEIPTDEMTKCAGCENDMLKSAKFCSDCGAQAATAEGDLDAAIGMLKSFTESRAAAEDELAALPAIDDIEVDSAAIGEIVKSATVADDDGNTGIDAMPIVAEFLKAQATTDARLNAGLGHLVKFVGYLAESNGIMAKALLAVAGEQKMLKADMGRIDGTTRGRRSDLAPEPVRQPGAVPSSELDADDIAPHDLIAKALVATHHDSTLLTDREFGALEHWTGNERLTLKGVCKADPSLGARVQNALAVTAAASH